MAKENISCLSVLCPRFLFEHVGWACVGMGARQTAWGRNGKKRIPDDELPNISEQSLKNTTADPFMNLLFSFCEVVLQVAGFAVVKEFSGKISLCS